MKHDERRLLTEYYPTAARARTPHLVEVPSGLFVMMDGQGDPNTSARYKEVVAAIYAVSYGAKFASKSRGQDYVVMPLEGLWWAEDMDAFEADTRDKWLWTMMIRQPSVVDEETVREARDSALTKGKISATQAYEIRIALFDEGLCAQVLHVGPYADEAPVIQDLHAFARRNGYRLRGRHHEVYLGDPRRSAPEKLKTIIRQPVAPL